MSYRDINYSLQRNPLVVPAILLAAGITIGSWLMPEIWMVFVALACIVGVAFAVRQPMYQTGIMYLSLLLLGVLLFSTAKPGEHTIPPPNAVQQWVDTQYERAGIQHHQLLTAMTVGKTLDTRDAVNEVRHEYSTAGVAHLLALSGLHVGFFYALVLFLAMKRKHSAVVQVLVLSAVWMYVLLTGAAASTVRAGIMVTLHALSLMLYRDPLPFNQVSLAALLILIVSPLQLFDIGFILSFCSVISIFLVMPLIMPKVENRLLRWVCASVCLSVAAQIGVAPVLANVFGQVTPYFLVANLVVVPAAMLVIYGAMAVLILSPVPMVQQGLARVVSFILDEMDVFIHHVANLPGADVSVSLNMAQTICCYITIVALVFMIKVLKD